MPEQPAIPRAEDPLKALRSAVENHRAATQASKDAGAALPAQPSVPAEPEAASR